MSYCRLSDADIYLYLDVAGYINCQCCTLAPKGKTIFTTGGKFFGNKIMRCKHCKGEGCEKCMMNGDTHLITAAEALEHIKAHREHGDFVPDYVDERLLQEIAAEHRLHTDKSGLAPTQAEYNKSVLSTPGSEPF